MIEFETLSDATERLKEIHGTRDLPEDLKIFKGSKYERKGFFGIFNSAASLKGAFNLSSEATEHYRKCKKTVEQVFREHGLHKPLKNYITTTSFGILESLRDGNPLSTLIAAAKGVKGLIDNDKQREEIQARMSVNDDEIRAYVDFERVRAVTFSGLELRLFEGHNGDISEHAEVEPALNEGKAVFVFHVPDSDCTAS
jgi:hypothetical protein